MNTLETYIFVHDQDIILDFNRKEKFKEFKNFKYVFLGSRSVDLIKDLPNVIIARNLKHNIEVYNKLTSFTGWYALYKNKIIKSNYVNLFEYDINYNNNFIISNNKLINSNPDAIGYLKLPVTSPFFIADKKFIEPLATAIKLKSNIDIYQLVADLAVKYPHLQWQTTSNTTWNIKIFNKYVEWISDYIEDFGYEQLAGHIVERSISLFYYIFKTNVVFDINKIEHLQLDSHKTDPNMPANYDKFADKFKKLSAANTLKVITFASEKFMDAQLKLKNHLNLLHIKDFKCFTGDDFPQEFKDNFSKILNQKRGYGYWLWKPLFILLELQKLSENEILLYIDSTDEPTEKFIEFLYNHFSQKDILLITRGYNHGQWTKRDCFTLMDCDSEIYYIQPQLEAGIIGVKNTPDNVKFIHEWITWCVNEHILTDIPNITEPNLPNFKDHRHDQSILTNLALRYKIGNTYINDSFVKFNKYQP